MPDFPLILDCSHYQPVLDIPAIKKAGVVGIIHKATQFTAATPVDAYYHQHKKQALDAGLLWGAYCFGDPGDGAKQADFFLNTVQPDGKTLLVLDLESGMNLQGAEQFVTRVHEVTGIYPWLYSSKLILERFIGKTSSVLTHCPLWLAGSNPSTPYPWENWLLWQYGYINFGNETFDANRFNGTLEELQEVWKLASPVIDDWKQLQLIPSNLIPVFKEPGGELFGWVRAGDSVTVRRAGQRTVDGVNYIDTPDDHWIRAEYVPGVQPNPTPDPVPAPLDRVTTTKVNFRNLPTTVGSVILVQVPAGRHVFISGPILNVQNNFVAATYTHTNGVTYQGFISNDYLIAPH